MTGTEQSATPRLIQLDGLTIDLDDYCIYYTDGTTTLLSGLEQLLLRTLIDAGGQVVTLEELGRKVWGWECGYSESAIWTCVSDLRRKLRDDPFRPRYIQTVHRIGYRVRSRLLPETIEPTPTPRRKERADGRRKH